MLSSCVARCNTHCFSTACRQQVSANIIRVLHLLTVGKQGPDVGFTTHSLHSEQGGHLNQLQHDLQRATARHTVSRLLGVLQKARSHLQVM